MNSNIARRIGALAVALAAWLPFAAAAQQPAAPAAAAPQSASSEWNKPPAWDAVSTKQQYASVPGRETNVLIQGAGHEWRKIRNGVIIFYGGLLLVVAFAVLAVIHIVKGPLKTKDPLTGRLVERFTSVERATHWTMATSFVVLGLTGIVILFGKHIILPIVGYAAFSSLTELAKNVHNFVGPLFIFALVIGIALFLRENAWKAYDSAWLAKFGGIFSGEHVPAGKYNAIQKLIFWFMVVGLCSVIAVAGLILNFPNWDQGREAMMLANIVHSVSAIVAMVIALVHIYSGTIGMTGAYNGMKTGYVDETWAREHHEYWFNEVKAGKRPEKMVTGSTQPATGD